MLLIDRPFRTLLSREVLRFTRVWMQTIVPPLLTSLLYLVVFGVALGSRIREVDGVPYLEYILPGIAFMSLITGSHMNSSWSVFDAKRERYIDEVLISPMSDLQIALAYSLGGTLRGLMMGAGIFVVGAPFVGVTVAHPGLLLLIAVFSSVEMLPGFLRVATLFDPIFHMVDAARYATLETSDLNPYPTLGVVFLLSALAFAGACWAINRGPNLRY